MSATWDSKGADDLTGIRLGSILGLWGVISGIAMFLTWDTLWRHENMWTIVFEIGLAVAVSFVTEWARGRVEGHIEKNTSILTTILILVILEFFVLGFHSIPSLETGDLRDISQRILGEASAVRPAKLYAFDIRSPILLRADFQMANLAFSSNNQEEVDKTRRGFVEVSARPSQALRDLLANKPPPQPTAKRLQEKMEEELRREPIAYAILQLQTPEDVRLIVNGSGAAGTGGLDDVLQRVLNRAIQSTDFYRRSGSEGEGQERRDLPRQAELERVNRRKIEEAFSDVIVPMPQPGRGEWIDLALAVFPLLIIGVYLGLAVVSTVGLASVNAAKQGKFMATLKGLGIGAMLGWLGAFLGFFIYLFLMRLGNHLFYSHEVLPRGSWILFPFKLAWSAFSYTWLEAHYCLGPAIQSAFMFVVPAATLCALVPWLKPPSRSPQFWSVIASASAALAMLASLLSHDRYWWIVIVSLAAIFVVRSIRAGKSIEWYWATGAVIVALFVCSVTVTVQTTLGGVMQDLHLFVQKPADPYGEWLAKAGNAGPYHLTQEDLIQGSLDSERWQEFEKSDNKKEYDRDMAAGKAEALTVGRALEICVVGGLGFWVTIAALAAWKIQSRD